MVRSWVILVCLLGLATPVLSAPSKAELKKLEQQIAREKQASQINKRKSSEVSQEINQVQRQMISSAKNIQRGEDQLSDLENQLRELNARQKELSQKLNLTDSQMVRVMTGLQTLALRPKELFITNAQTPIDILRSRSLMYASVPVLGQNSEALKKDLAELSRVKADTLAKAAQIKEKTEQLSEQAAQMDRLIKQKSLLQAQYTVQHQQAASNARQLAGKAKNLKDLLEQLELDRQRRQAEAVKKAYLATGRAAAPGNLTSSAVSGSFKKSYGSLLYPVRGKIVSNFGETTITGSKTRGMSMNARPNAQVIAPFDGTVLFSGPFKGYDNLVIIDHNNGYLSLLAGMRAVQVSIGQELLAGEPVGLMKEKNPTLYIEIRKDGNAIDPKPWFIPML